MGFSEPAMNYLEIFTLILNLIFCLPTLASITTLDNWWVRGFDFPRIQICVLIIANITLSGYVYSFDELWQYLVTIALVLSLAYQYWLIHPYTVLAKKQVIRYSGEANEDNISILVSNVLTSNRNYAALIDLVRARNPDILLTLESDKKWEEALTAIEDSYGHCVKVPLDNLYGMHLYSKLPLSDIAVKYLVQDGIPSIHGHLQLRNGKTVSIHCLHPKPPSPSESKTSTNRDAELLLVGQQIDSKADLVLVFGDLNDVAWSRTTKMFQKLSGLMDPRRGRGFFNTYNANHKLLRWPLDHVFHSNDFTLMEISREKNIGSDHFPMYLKLNYTPKAKWMQEDLDISETEEKWAREKIDKGNPKDRTI